MQRWTHSVTTLLLLNSLSGPLSAQERPTVFDLSEYSCPECSIRLEHALRIGDDSGPGRIERTDVVTQRGDGTFVVHLQFDPGFMQTFGPAGEYLGRFGKQGGGPGEFQTIQELIALETNSIVAFDYQNQRATILNGEGQARATIPLRGFLPSQTGVVAFPEDSLLFLCAHVRTADRVGYPLHLVDFGGRVRRSFGAPPNVVVDLDEKQFKRRLAGSPGGNVWAAHLRDYVLDEWSLAGVQLRSYRRHPEWYVVEDPYVPISPRGGRFSEVMDIELDRQSGHLWVLVQVPSSDADWADGLISEEYGGKVEYGPGDYDKLYDTMVEVIDVQNNRLLASQRVAPALRRFVAPNLASSFGSDPTTGVEFLNVWRVTLLGPTR